MEIYSKGDYPACALSNFAAYDFTVDGVECKSMEGFLQSLKYRNQAKQTSICLLAGKEAKLKGKHKYLWRWTGNVWWQGRKIKRCSKEFALLIDKAYDALFENEKFKQALRDSGNEPFTHEMGKSDPRKTILTELEFISRLTELRDRL